MMVRLGQWRYLPIPMAADMGEHSDAERPTPGWLLYHMLQLCLPVLLYLRSAAMAA
jgi:hypothetical protein